MKIKIAKKYIYILIEIYNIVISKNNMHNIFNITYLKSKNKNKNKIRNKITNKIRDNAERNKTISCLLGVLRHNGIKINIQRRKEKLESGERRKVRREKHISDQGCKSFYFLDIEKDLSLNS